MKRTSKFAVFSLIAFFLCSALGGCHSWDAAAVQRYAETWHTHENFNTLADDDIAPEFSFDDLKGERHSLSEFKGRPTLLEFWVPRFGVCPDRAAMLNKLKENLGDSCNLIAISLGTKREILLDVVKEKKLEYLHGWLDEAESLAILEKYGIARLPFMILLDSEGKVVLHGIPYLPTKQLRALVEKCKIGGFAAKNYAEMRGKVVAKNGSPISNAQVKVEIIELSEFARAGAITSVMRKACTDAQGVWKITKVPRFSQRIIVRVYHPLYVALPEERFVSPESRKDFLYEDVRNAYEHEISTVLTKELSFSVQITDNNGVPMSGALFGDGGDCFPYPLRTDENGYIFANLPFAKHAPNVHFPLVSLFLSKQYHLITFAQTETMWGELSEIVKRSSIDRKIIMRPDSTMRISVKNVRGEPLKGAYVCQLGDHYYHASLRMNPFWLLLNDDTRHGFDANMLKRYCKIESHLDQSSRTNEAGVFYLSGKGHPSFHDINPHNPNYPIIQIVSENYIDGIYRVTPENVLPVYHKLDSPEIEIIYREPNVLINPTKWSNPYEED